MKNEEFSLHEEKCRLIINKLENDPEEISLEFDSTYGFPTDVFFDMSLMIADEEIRLTFTDFNSSTEN